MRPTGQTPISAPTVMRAHNQYTVPAVRLIVAPAAVEPNVGVSAVVSCVDGSQLPDHVPFTHDPGSTWEVDTENCGAVAVGSADVVIGTRIDSFDSDCTVCVPLIV
jgi:hypothetical protein